VNKSLASIDGQSPDCDRLASELNILANKYSELWLVRNRIGGLKESLSYFKKSLE
jgi:hypothetical protein